MIFNPAIISAAILEPLRYFFEYEAPEEFRYSPNVGETKIAIESIFDLNTETRGFLPRILVDRGDFQVAGIGLSNSLAEGKSLGAGFGKLDEIRGATINGMAGIAIVASNEGTAEFLGNLVYHFLLTMYPVICDYLGFKVFGMPLNVSRPLISKEDKEVFRINISFPYSTEEQWRIQSNAVTIKNILVNVQNAVNSLK